MLRTGLDWWYGEEECLNIRSLSRQDDGLDSFGIVGSLIS